MATNESEISFLRLGNIPSMAHVKSLVRSRALLGVGPLGGWGLENTCRTLECAHKVVQPSPIPGNRR